MPKDHITWRETRERLECDRARLRRSGARRVFLHPSYSCVWLYRLSHYLHHRGLRRIARFVWHFNVIATGADIPPTSSFDAGLLIPHPVGVCLVGAAGRNFTSMALAGLGGELGRLEDVGAGPGVPMLGNDVYLAPASGVLGPTRIGHRVRLSPGCIVARDVADDCAVHGPPAVVEPVALTAR